MPCYDSRSGDPTFNDSISTLEEIHDRNIREVDRLTDMLCRIGKVIVYNDRERDARRPERCPVPSDIVSWFRAHELFDEQRKEPWK